MVVVAAEAVTVAVAVTAAEEAEAVVSAVAVTLVALAVAVIPGDFAAATLEVTPPALQFFPLSEHTFHLIHLHPAIIPAQPQPAAAASYTAQLRTKKIHLWPD